MNQKESSVSGNLEILCFRLCVLGRRLLKDINILTDCNKNVSGALHRLYCGNSTRCDPYYTQNNITIVNGIRGLASGVFLGKIVIFLIIAEWEISIKQKCRIKIRSILYFSSRREYMGQVPRGGSVDRLRERPEGY